MAIHSRILDWRIPWTAEPGGLQSSKTPVRNHSVQKFVPIAPSRALSLECGALRDQWLTQQRSSILWLLLSPTRCLCILLLVTQSCPTLATPWTVAYQAPLSMGFSRQEYWSG